MSRLNLTFKAQKDAFLANQRGKCRKGVLTATPLQTICKLPLIDNIHPPGAWTHRAHEKK